ncbi:MAG: hypothetical protein C4293_00485, partial [Nitrospiraceae bacterium]
FIAEIMIIVGSWQKYPFQVIVAVIGIVLTMAYLFRMMRGVFYGPTVEKYGRTQDAVAFVDRMPLLLMIACSISFGIFPGHFYSVIRSGVNPLITRITQVVPLAQGVHQPSAFSAQLTDGAGEGTRHSSTNTGMTADR